MKDELMRRISDALDRDRGLDGELRALVEGDDEALRYAQDLVRIDEVLRQMGERRPEPDWDALAARIDERLDEELDELDVDSPPRFDDAEVALEARAIPEVSQELPVAAAPATARDRAPAPVTDLASRRRSGVFVWLGGLAAAAAVGLGITFGMTSFDEAPAGEIAAAPQQAEALDEEARQAWAPPAEAAEEAPALPAAAAVQPAPQPGAMPPSPEPMAGLARRAPAVPMAAPAGRLSRASDSLARGGGGGSAPAAEPVPAATAAQPSRAEVITAVHAVEPTVQRCLAQRGETAHVLLQIGADGSIVAARVAPPYSGREAQCIVDAVRTARLPAGPEDYQLAYVFHPAPIAGGSATRPPAAARHRRAAAREMAAPASTNSDTVEH